MWLLLLNMISLICFNHVEAQRVAPGVPPQHYQQPPHPQYQQQQQHQQHFQQPQVPVQQVPQQQIHQQQQQIHQQQQQVHQQQVPIQPLQQQVPHQQGHHHGHGVPQPGQILNAANIVQEKEHIAEHLEVPMDTSKMTDQELQFHYFKMHDADNNNKLDGCELIKSLIHWHGNGPQPLFSDKEIQEVVDPLLERVDENRDGFVEYYEYRKYSAL